ncbi:MAG: hypothetical protein QOI41_688 [Myxococcales bacterium]|nr:hypothetical protein [Myxococcales bacterium]
MMARPIHAVALCSLALMVVSACAQTGNVGLYRDDAGVEAGVPSFEPPPDAADGGEVKATTDASLLLCEGTECPSPYATCGATSSVRCGTNLMNDKANCGSCGNACPDYDLLNMTSRCVAGACVLECQSSKSTCSILVYKNCNGLVDDGCETPVSDDPQNCGACGHACAPGQPCVQGMCGCPDGKSYCPNCSALRPDVCIDLSASDQNCGGCGKTCPQSFAGACAPKPTNTHYGCGAGTCGKLKCVANTADCDNDLALGCSSNGCEVDVTTDPKNCGACGNACAPGQECRDDGNGPQCLAPCEASGKASCPDKCADLLSDPANCGACGLGCAASDNEQAECRKGVCTTHCADGFADCDGNPSNGCEVNLANDPTSCGSCGVTCDFVGGQPCVEGRCLMVECDAGPLAK